MKFAFSRPTATKEQRETLFLNYRSVGYDGLQLKYGQYAPYLNNPGSFIEEWGNQEGVASALIAGGKLDEHNHQEMKSILAFAQTVGVERIVFCHGIPRNEIVEDDLKKFASQLSELGKEAYEQFGVQLSLHHHHNQPVMYRSDFDVFFDNVRGDSVNLTVDTAHLYASGIRDIAEVIYSFKDRIDNFHMKDFADGDWKVLGEGIIDFKPIFKAIQTIEYDGWISADEESGSGILQGMRDCYRYMKEGLIN
ncbi:sugar phosphate isomerase/epimerase family protein [Bacillus solitudinis]|uniref:sugar phosphate isomerase/epimerase family protein n=1 Tax=Bacillus solitudinis TaxID=2014074 RepID=UPI000C236112|nr:sugar phosphate isomerase/epimerase [Bacillus solitudinis]